MRFGKCMATLGPPVHTGAKASETDFNFLKVFWTKMVLYHSKSSDIDLFWP